MIEWLKEIDIKILLAINQHFNPFLDKLMWTASEVNTWIPFYALLIALLIYRYKKESWLMIVLVLPLILLTDQTSSAVIRPLVARWRPSHQAGLDHMLHYVNNYQGGDYGFVSSHAANVFGLATYITLVACKKLKWLPYLMFVWAVFVSYSRIYLGVHYPTDVLCGALIGVAYAWFMSGIYFRIKNRRTPLPESKTTILL